MAVLEAVTKGPGCQDDDGERAQIMLKVRKPQLAFEPCKSWSR